MTGFNIDEFKSKVLGLQKASKFMVEIGHIGGFGFPETEVNSQFYCEAVDLPASALLTNEFRRYGYGPMEKRPYAPLFSECKLVFRSDQDGKIFDFFHTWHDIVVHRSARDTITDKNGWVNGERSNGILVGKPRREHTMYEVNYKNQYCAEVVIKVFDEAGEASVGYVLKDAYPSAIGESPMAWAMQNAYVQIPVSLTFTEMTVRNKTPHRVLK